MVDTKIHYAVFSHYALIKNGQGKEAFVSQDERESRQKWTIHLWFSAASFTELQRPLILLPVAVILKTDLDCCATPRWLDSSYVIVNQFILEHPDWIRIWPLKAIFLTEANREFHISRKAYTTLTVAFTVWTQRYTLYIHITEGHWIFEWIGSVIFSYFSCVGIWCSVQYGMVGIEGSFSSLRERIFCHTVVSLYQMKSVYEIINLIVILIWIKNVSKSV